MKCLSGACPHRDACNRRVLRIRLPEVVAIKPFLTVKGMLRTEMEVGLEDDLRLMIWRDCCSAVRGQPDEDDVMIDPKESNLWRAVPSVVRSSPIFYPGVP